MSDGIQELASRLASMPGVGRVSIEMDNGSTDECGLHTILAEQETLGFGILVLAKTAAGLIKAGQTREALLLLDLIQAHAEAIYDEGDDE